MNNLVTQFHAICESILRNRESKSLNYAVEYARAGMSMTQPKVIQVQSLYILNNITRWRGKDAEEARRVLKLISKPSTWELVS